MSRYSRWCWEMIDGEKSDICNLHNLVCGAAGGAEFSWLTEQTVPLPKYKSLNVVLCVCPKRIGKKKWGNPLLHCTDHAFSLRSILYVATWMPSACWLAGDGSEPGHLSNQFQHFKIAPSTSALSGSHHTHTHWQGNWKLLITVARCLF